LCGYLRLTIILLHRLLIVLLTSGSSVNVRQNDEGIVESHWKGAAEIILGLCTKFVNERGEVQALTPGKVHNKYRPGFIM
jgi:hypothetical protein